MHAPRTFEGKKGGKAGTVTTGMSEVAAVVPESSEGESPRGSRGRIGAAGAALKRRASDINRVSAALQKSKSDASEYAKRVAANMNKNERVRHARSILIIYVAIVALLVTLSMTLNDELDPPRFAAVWTRICANESLYGSQNVTDGSDMRPNSLRFKLNAVSSGGWS